MDYNHYPDRAAGYSSIRLGSWPNIPESFHVGTRISGTRGGELANHSGYFAGCCSGMNVVCTLHSHVPIDCLMFAAFPWMILQSLDFTYPGDAQIGSIPINQSKGWFRQLSFELFNSQFYIKLLVLVRISGEVARL